MKLYLRANQTGFSTRFANVLP